MRYNLAKEPFVTIMNDWLLQNSFVLFLKLGGTCRHWNNVVTTHRTNFNVWGQSKESLRLLKKKQNERKERMLKSISDLPPDVLSPVIIDLYGINTNFDAISNYAAFGGTTSESDDKFKFFPAIIGKSKLVSMGCMGMKFQIPTNN
jgi:hypothetical protein